MKKLLTSLAASVLAISGLMAVPAPAQALLKSDDRLVVANDPSCQIPDEYWACSTNMVIRTATPPPFPMPEVFDISVVTLTGSNGKVVSKGPSFIAESGANQQYARTVDPSAASGYSYFSFLNNPPLPHQFGSIPNDNYTLTVDWKYSTVKTQKNCTPYDRYIYTGGKWTWGRCSIDEVEGTYRVHNYATSTYKFKWSGSRVTASPVSIKATVSKTATTATTYTAKKTHTHTAVASYKATEKATYTYKGKRYTATASATAKATSAVKRTGTYKANKLKRTATRSATASSILGKTEAQRLAGVKALDAAKKAATQSARSYADAQALAKAKASISKADKTKATNAAKAKLTTAVKKKAHANAKAAALKAAKKKAGR